MKSLSGRFKFFFILIGLFLVLYLSRHFIFATVFQHIVSEKFEYKSRAWDDGNLIYRGVTLGKELNANELRLTPEFTLFPFHISLEVYLTEPHFHLSTDAPSSFNLALLTPTKWTSFKFDIERGSLAIDEEPLGSIDLLSGDDPTKLGTLILSKEGSPYCTTTAAFRGSDLFYELQLESAPALHLHTFMNFFSVALPFHLQGGLIDADLRGTSSSMEGTVTGSDLELATSHGEFDFHKLVLSGSYSEKISIDATLEGGRFTNGSLMIDGTDAHLSVHPDKAPLLFAKGHVAVGEVQGPFTCEAEGDVMLEGKLQFAGLHVPFSISQEGSSSIIYADIKDMPLTWFRCEEGLGSTQAIAFFENEKLKLLELKNLQLTLLKIDELSCNSIRGDIAIKEMKSIEHASLNVENLSLGQIYKNGIGTIVIGENRFLTCEMKGAVNHIPMQVVWHGSFDKIEGEIFSSLVPEGSIDFKGEINQGLHLSCIGTDLLIQTETEMLQIPGQTASLDINWSLQDKKLSALMRVPPSTLYLKSIPSPIYIEGGALTWSDTILEIKQLQACLEETTFQGDLAYWQTPKPHVQLTSRAIEGPLQDLAIFDKRLRGWHGHFVCGKEGFLLDADLDGSSPQIHLKAHLDDLSHSFTPAITLSKGALDLSYASIGGELVVNRMTGLLSLSEKTLSFQIPQLKAKADHYIFSMEVPEEKISLTGEFENHELCLTKAQIGPSKITQPLYAVYQNGIWNLQGGAILDLGSLSHHFLLADFHIPSMTGVVNVSGSFSPETASLDLASSGIKIGDFALPSFKGHINREKNHFKSENLLIGEAHFTGHAINENNIWLFPEWTAVWKDLHLQGSGRLEETLCSLKTEGSWKETLLQAQVNWDLKTQQGRNNRLTFQHDAFKVTLSTNDLKYKDGKLEAQEVHTTILHPQLKESITAPLNMSWTPERLIFQGPISQGTFENDLFKLKPRDIQALYENGVLHFQSKLQLNDSPIKAKGNFAEGGRGMVKLFEADHELQVNFATFTEITQIQGKLFGIDCSLKKKGTLYEGRLKIETSDPLAALLNKPEWKQFENLEFVGLLSTESFKGTVSGTDVTLQGYLLNQLQVAVDYRPTQFDIRQLKIDDKAGQLLVKECRGLRSHPLKAWEITIPHMRGQHLQPSLLRKKGQAPTEPKPFQIRQLTLTEVTGIMGRPLSFKGHGSFYFTQKEKRDPSLFDLPRAFLKEWGLDLALLSPARGSATIELAQGKMIFNSLSETFSDGDHSEFYLTPEEPSYIDFNGGLFLNLRMKQNVALKLVEPFTISVRGTWEKPHYTLR